MQTHKEIDDFLHYIDFLLSKSPGVWKAGLVKGDIQAWRFVDKTSTASEGLLVHGVQLFLSPQMLDRALYKTSEPSEAFEVSLWV